MMPGADSFQIKGMGVPDGNEADMGRSGHPIRVEESNDPAGETPRDSRRDAGVTVATG
jgi:hypothetical protein